MKYRFTTALVFACFFGSYAQAGECREKTEQYESYVASTADGVGSEEQLVALAKTAVQGCESQALSAKNRRVVRIIRDAQSACVQASDQMSAVYTAYCNSKIAQLAVYLLP